MGCIWTASGVHWGYRRGALGLASGVRGTNDRLHGGCMRGTGPFKGGSRSCRRAARRSGGPAAAAPIHPNDGAVRRFGRICGLWDHGHREVRMAVPATPWEEGVSEEGCAKGPRGGRARGLCGACELARKGSLRPAIRPEGRWHERLRQQPVAVRQQPVAARCSQWTGGPEQVACARGMRQGASSCCLCGGTVPATGQGRVERIRTDSASDVVE